MLLNHGDTRQRFSEPSFSPRVRSLERTIDYGRKWTTLFSLPNYLVLVIKLAFLINVY
jgi:hypothetical protein